MIVKAPYLKVKIHIQAFMSDGKREGYSLMSLRHLIEHLEVRAVNKKKTGLRYCHQSLTTLCKHIK